jgi:methyl-accepting chemotaxis protein
MLNSLKGKLIIPVFGLLTLMVIVMIVWIAMLTGMLFSNLTDKRMENATRSAQARIENLEEQSRVVAISVANSYTVLSTIRGWNAAEDGSAERLANRQVLFDYLQGVAREVKADSFIVRDAEGRTILRIHAPTNFNDFDGSAAGLAALEGRTTTSYSSTPTMALGLNTTVPIYDDGVIIGTMTPLYFLHTNEFMQYMANLFDAEVSIFNRSESIVSTLPNGVGIEWDAGVAETVIGRGQPLTAEETISGKAYHSFYIPVHGLANNGAPVGALFVGFSNEEADHLIFRIYRTMILISVVGIAVTGGVMYLIIQKVLQPLDTLKKRVKEVAEGNININIDKTRLSNDEIGELSLDVFALTDVIKGIMADLDRLMKEMTDKGEIEYRIGSDKYHGSYKEIIDGINNFADTYVDEVLMVIKIIDEVGAGKFDVELRDLPGKKVILAQKVNAFLATIRSIITDINGLADAAAGGDLGVQADPSKYTGDWAMLLEHLNDLISTVAEKAFWYESLLDSIPFPISVTDLNMNWTFINKPTEVFLGKGRKDVLGQHCSNWGATICNSEQCGIKCFKRGVKQTKFTQGGLYFQVDVESLKDSRGREIGYIEVVQETTKLETALSKVNEVMDKVRLVSEQVSVGSKHISASGADLASGAGAQAARIQELNESVEMINKQTQVTAKNATNANDLSKNAKQNAIVGNDEMKMMVSAMDGITEAQNSISKIIKTIEDIAFQTNLLALNAAVEAARAGEHGKGFAVVAEEVRNLAARSQVSAKETNQLITESKGRVDKGTEIAIETAKTLEQIVADFDNVSKIIADIAAASSEQAQSIMSVSSGLVEISSITQANSAASEETAAASEELASQADILMDLVRS